MCDAAVSGISDVISSRVTTSLDDGRELTHSDKFGVH